MARRSTCNNCWRKIVEKPADREYIDTFGEDGLAWMDVVESRSMCLVDRYGTAHTTTKEFYSAS
jgi:hypothetical protein